MSMFLWPHTILYSKKLKMVLYPENKMELDTQAHTYLESLSPVECHQIFILPHHLLYPKKKKRVKNGTLLEK